MDSNRTAVAGGVRAETLDGGAIRRLTLATPKANILDLGKIEALSHHFDEVAADRDIKAILLDAEGDHFSFGASVEEHLPGQFERMIPTFGALFRKMLDTPVMTLAAVQGQCLGGGLELVSMCQRVFASPTAKMGQPEIVLGVIAPIASVILPERIGRWRAADLCVSGRTVGAEEALGMGLADELADDPTGAALAWARKYLVPRSASSLRLAVRAARIGWTDTFKDRLAEAEQLYRKELMGTADAEEGLRAFLDRREPVWRNA
jgi:cyclohexa-1,5-dienecarbonyl-CoA hydratase